MRIIKAALLITVALLICSLPLITRVRAQMLLDFESVQCLSCHQEVTITPSAEVCHAGNCDHKIGTDYVSLSKTKSGYVNADFLNPAIKLVNDKVSCVTCHVAYSAEDHESLAAKRTPESDPLLVIDNAGSALCTACHRK